MSDNGSDCLVSVDGVDFEIEEPYPYHREVSKIWFSHKFKGPGLRYEVAVCIQTGDIVKIEGPYCPGDWNDAMIFADSTIPLLDEGERVEADGGYHHHDPEYAKTPNGASWKDETFGLQDKV